MSRRSTIWKIVLQKRARDNRTCSIRNGITIEKGLDMKQIHFVIVWIALLFLNGVFIFSAFSQTYKTDFNALEERDWELWGDDSSWIAEDGHLKGQMPVLDLLGIGTEMELLQFKGFQGPYKEIEIFDENKRIRRQLKKQGDKEITISVENLGITHGFFGIALGRMFPEHPGDQPFFYMFMNHQVKTARFNGWGGFATPFTLWREPHNPDTLWKTNELHSMEIRYNKGHFQWFSNGEKRADFEDPGFTPIEIVGFVLVGTEHGIADAWVDSFTITGPGLFTSPQTKIATTWGQLKQKE